MGPHEAGVAIHGIEARTLREHARPRFARDGEERRGYAPQLLEIGGVELRERVETGTASI